MSFATLGTILWLRWRLMHNQSLRGGGLKAVVAVLFAVGAVVLAGVCFAGAGLLGCFGVREASPESIYFNVLRDGASDDRAQTARLIEKLTTVQAFAPPFWVSVGARTLADGRAWPALLGTLRDDEGRIGTEPPRLPDPYQRRRGTPQRGMADSRLELRSSTHRFGGDLVQTGPAAIARDSGRNADMTSEQPRRGPFQGVLARHALAFEAVAASVERIEQRVERMDRWVRQGVFLETAELRDSHVAAGRLDSSDIAVIDEAIGFEGGHARRSAPPPEAVEP